LPVLISNHSKVAALINFIDQLLFWSAIGLAVVVMPQVFAHIAITLIIASIIVHVIYIFLEKKRT
jgi:5-bromo-4-chloroindolyl phosphate hydrolysis protein